MDKHQIKQLSLKINQILNEWDPIGVADDHYNEYVFYIDHLISMVNKKATREKFRSYLVDLTENQMGLDHVDHDPKLENALDKLMNLKVENSGQINCDVDGPQTTTFVCQHIAQSLETKKRVGFHWSKDSKDQWPDATCTACVEKRNKATTEEEDSKIVEEFSKPQILCAKCYERAKRLNLGWLGYYLHIYTPTLIWPKKITKHEKEQKEICKKYNVEFVPSSPDDKIGISDDTDGKAVPINGIRYPEGWFVWSGETLTSADDYFKPHHIKHLDSLCPQIIKYLGLPPGYRFQIDNNGHEDVWFDEQILKDED